MAIKRISVAMAH